MICTICGKKFNPEYASDLAIDYSVCSECMEGRTEAEKEQEYFNFEQLIAGDYR